MFVMVNAGSIRIDVRHHVTGTRWTRSVYGIGGKALREVLKEATNAGPIRSDVRHHVTGTRWTRSVFGIGGKALREVLKEATELARNNPGKKRFLKHGAEAEALEDFKYLMAGSHTHYNNFGIKGVKGSDKIQLRYHDRRNSRRPSLTISNSSMSVTIVYTKKPVL